MKPAPFQYFAPTTLDETLALLAEHGDSAKALAGGQSLVPMMNFRLVTPATLIDLNRVQELAYIQRRDGGLALGAMVRQRQLERDPAIARAAPLVAETMPFIAHAQIRNRGTLGGSLAHADPAAELPAVMVALDAELTLTRRDGARRIGAEDFFVGLFTTTLEPTELLTQVTIPRMPPRSGWAFQEMSRRHGDYALAGVATTLALDERGVCQEARIVLLGLGTQPVHARDAAALLLGSRPTLQAIKAAAHAVDAEIDPATDIHASAQFRRHLARVLTQRALETATRRAQGETA